MLKHPYSGNLIEAGCDEAGRGCLAGPLFAAAVILPRRYRNERLRDSKKLNPKQRQVLREEIEKAALAWAVASVGPGEIDEVNILNATFLAMHDAVSQLSIRPQFLLIDGNRFTPYPSIPHRCFIRGDDRFLAIAAASVLAKTHRDEHMAGLHSSFPLYGWDRNKGYPSKMHREAILRYGTTIHHRMSFNLVGQLKLELR
jgi:ribonuclease HII